MCRTNSHECSRIHTSVSCKYTYNYVNVQLKKTKIEFQELKNEMWVNLETRDNHKKKSSF